MTHYHVDERDIMFILKECPGLDELLGLEAFGHCDEGVLDMVFEQSKSFCQQVLAPLHGETDRQGCRLEDGEVILPESIGRAWDQYRELELIGINCETEYGGTGLPHFFSIPITELECGSFVSFSMLPLLTRGAARLIMNFASEELKRLFLPRMFSGAWSGTMCLTEPNAGSDVGAGLTKAIPEGDHYKISGTKIFITWGDHPITENIVHLVLARTPDAPAGSKGLSLFVVPKYRVDASGKVQGPNDVICGNVEHKMGIKASPTCVINFGTDDGCIGYMVGDPCQGIQYMFQMMNEARIEVGVQGMAQASAAYLSALSYAGERVQGTVMAPDGPRAAKIVEHPDVRRMLLKMRALAQGSRALLYNVMYYVDMAAHHPTESEKYQILADLLTPICKSYGSDQGFRATELAVQTYGGYGYCQEYPVEQYLRDCKIASIYEGTNGIQAMDLVFRKILRDRGNALRLWIGEAMQLCEEVDDTELAPLAADLRKAAEQVAATAEDFGRRMAADEVDRVRFHATDFQEQMGHVVVSYLLLNQSKVALFALAKEPGDADRHFYQQKVVTTRYYFNDMLGAAVSALQTMTRDEVPGLDAAF